MVLDRDGFEREVDVLVEIPTGSYTLRIAVECRDHARSADLTWIEQLRAKYDEIPTIDRVVAVSRQGFSKKAIAKAKSLRMTTVSLGQAVSLDWRAKIQQITDIEVRIRAYRLKNVSLSLIADTPSEPRSFSPDDALLRSPDGNEMPLDRTMRGLLSLPNIRSQIDQALEKHTGDITLNSTMKGWSVRIEGEWRPVSHVDLRVTAPTDTGRIAIQQVEFAGAAVAFGSGDVGEFDCSVVSAVPRERKDDMPLHVHLSAKAQRGRA